MYQLNAGLTLTLMMFEAGCRSINRASPQSCTRLNWASLAWRSLVSCYTVNTQTTSPQLSCRAVAAMHKSPQLTQLHYQHNTLRHYVTHYMGCWCHSTYCVKLFCWHSTAFVVSDHDIVMTSLCQFTPLDLVLYCDLPITFTWSSHTFQSAQFPFFCVERPSVWTEGQWHENFALFDWVLTEYGTQLIASRTCGCFGDNRPSLMWDSECGQTISTVLRIYIKTFLSRQ